MAINEPQQVWPHPAYRVETDRLVLRCYDPSDGAELARAFAANRDHLAEWMPQVNSDFMSPDACVERLRGFRARFDLGIEFIYGVFEPSSGKIIGGAGLHARVGPHALEIGYWIAGDRVRQGLATEASAALTRISFELLGARRLEIRCDPANVPSAGVPSKLGYARDGILRWTYFDGDEPPRDSLVHTMTADDYPASPAARYPARAFDVIGRPLPLAAPAR